MTPSQLRQWSFQNSQPDQWWLNLDAVTEEIPVTVAEIEERLKSGDYSAVQALHVSQAGMTNAPWVEVVMPLPMKAPRLMQLPSIADATAALSAFGPPLGTPQTPPVEVVHTKAQNVGCGILALLLFLLFGYVVIWMIGIKRDQNAQSAAEARVQERTDAQATEANLKYNREHSQSQSQAGQEVRQASRSHREVGEHTISGDNFTGFSSLEDEERASELAGDTEAFSKFFLAGVMTRRATLFKRGETVILEDSEGLLSSKVKLRRKGEAVSYWTNREAID